MIRRLLCLFLLLLAAAPALAQQPTHIEARLIGESAEPAPGATVTLAFAMAPAPGWHGYWANPGDAGLGMTVDWTLPPGVEALPLRYPVPHTLLIAGLMNHVYEGPYALLTGLRLPPGLARGTRIPVRAKAQWLACTREVCVPEQGRFAIDLVVGQGAVAPADRAFFDVWRAQLPAPLAQRGRYAVGDGTVRLELPYPAAAPLADAHFFAQGEGAVRYAAPQRFLRDGDRLIVETAAGNNPGGAIAGVLRTSDDGGLAVTFDRGPVAAGGVEVGRAAPAADPGAILLAFLGALAGGLLLNIMPCVFPILSIKALSLARAGGDERGARIEALGYTAGAILTALALGAALLLLRAGGEQVGWAFQLQEPRVVAALLLLAAAMTLNLAGLFELPVLAGGSGTPGHGFLGSLGTGALAAFVATPCAGPFMAAAIGAAVLLPWPAAMAIFGGLGLGLALPFLAVGYVPALRRRLPKPGRWLRRFRTMMAVPMALTALALCWLVWRQGGVPALAMALAAAALLAGSLAYVGARQRGGRAAGWLAPIAGIAASAAIVAALPFVASVPPAASAGLPGAEPFSEARLAALRAEGRPVFVYFTADWCLSCKVNEAAAIDRDATRAAFAKSKVAVLVGDWTRRDAAIGRFLTAHGRSGIPYYLVYPANGGAPKELPQILTADLLAEAVR